MGDTSAKKELQKKKKRQKQEKADKMRERKENSSKGKSLEDMMAYLDENGNLTSTPPDPKRKREINLEDIQLGAAARIEEDPADAIRKGTIAFFNNDKGYGFIIDSETKQNVFVHMNNLQQPVKERDMVSYETEKTPRGLSAINVKKI